MSTLLTIAVISGAIVFVAILLVLMLALAKAASDRDRPSNFDWRRRDDGQDEQ